MIQKVLFVFFIPLTLLLAFDAPGEAAEEIKLDADKISFEESTGVATAEGNVRISGEEIKLVAPYVEYDSLNQNVRAVSTPEGSVTFISGGRRVNGERLDYSLTSRRGMLTMPNGRVDAFYVKGDSIEVMPASDVTGRKTASGDEDLAATWRGAVITTCSYPEPHYRLESKEMTILPGRRIVIRKPKIYLGETLLFTYPFDYTLFTDSRSRFDRQAIFPKIGYESDKGVGIGISGPLVWDSGSLNIEALWWSENIWEGEAFLSQSVALGLTAYGSIRREYDKDSQIALWRPLWGLEYDWNGWLFDIRWSERELVSIEKNAGADSRYVVWKDPEASIVSPWFNDAAASGKFRLLGSWGRYEDVSSGGYQSIAERIGAGVQIYGEFGSTREKFQPFYNALYWYYSYDDDIQESQQILDTVFGVRWKIGNFDMESAYLRRWTWGDSPMLWDDYNPREEVYQQVGVILPTKSPDDWWKLAVRGAYSIDGNELAEMAYKAIYNQHCLQWEMIYRDDLRGGDDWLGLKLTINAYPESGLRLMGGELFDPAKAPDSLAPDSVRK
jgi:LPS-assembly protein